MFDNYLLLVHNICWLYTII